MVELAKLFSANSVHHLERIIHDVPMLHKTATLRASTTNLTALKISWAAPPNRSQDMRKHDKDSEFQDIQFVASQDSNGRQHPGTEHLRTPNLNQNLNETIDAMPRTQAKQTQLPPC